MRNAQTELKSGQIAVILGLDPKQIQNTVDAGYIRPAIKAHGRGQLRLYSFENLIQFKVLHTLVQAYGLEKQAAAKMLKRAWPRPFTPQVKTLELHPMPASQDWHLPLEPIRVLLGEIIASTQARAEKTLRQYQEKKRGRPVGWKKEITAALEPNCVRRFARYRRQRHTGASASATPAGSNRARNSTSTGSTSFAFSRRSAQCSQSRPAAPAAALRYSDT